MTKDPSHTLSPEQAHALFDVLTHHQLYAEISKFKYPDAIDQYGPPFQPELAEEGKESTSPILQSLLQRFVASLPGLRDVSPEFWQERVKNIVKKLGEAELSESYDKGKIGSRKTLATASAVLIEYPARGCLGGFAKKNAREGQEYDTSDADDVIRAWEDFCQELVYGDIIDELFEKVAKTDKLEEHSPLVQGAHEYILVNLASFLHFIMVHSPDGPYLARIIENVHKLVPYGMIRQTLRIGNAATMINSMVRLLLTKLSVSTLTNWIGLTNYADTGMNMLQTIVSTVIGWDISALQKSITKTEKQGPSKEHLNSIKDHMQNSRDEHDAVRLISQAEEKSIVTVIFENAGLEVEEITESQHDVAMTHLSIHLSIRDREQLSSLICSQQPDIVTQAIKDVVAAYDPIIRGIHSAVDLSAGLTDLENFMNDFVKLIKPPNVNNKNGKASETSTPVPARLPSVEDYVQLLRKHMPSSHRFFHQICKNGGEVANQYREYAKAAAKHFRPHHRRRNSFKSGDRHSQPQGAGTMTPYLEKMVSELPAEQRQLILQTLDSHFAFMMALEASSRDRMHSVLENCGASTASTPGGPYRGNGTMYGPGMYLSRWQQLMEETPISPKTPRGPVRRGADTTVKQAEGEDLDGTVKARGAVGLEELGLQPPDVSKVIEILGPKFRHVLEEAWKKSEAAHLHKEHRSSTHNQQDGHPR